MRLMLLIIIAGSLASFLQCSKNSIDDIQPETPVLSAWTAVANLEAAVVDFAGYGDTIWAASDGRGLFRSADNGLTWQFAGLPATRIRSIAINSSGKIYCGLPDGRLFSSTDNGDVWQPLPLGFDTGSILDLLINRFDHLFIASTNALLRSTDHGRNWSSHQNGLSPFYLQTLQLGPENVFWGGSPLNGVLLSRDNGDNWQQTNLSNNPIRAVAILDAHSIFAGGPSGQLFYSENGGGLWQELATGIPREAINAIIVPELQSVAVATANGVIYSGDGGNSWKPANDGLSGQHILSLHIVDANQILAGSREGIIYRAGTR